MLDRPRERGVPFPAPPRGPSGRGERETKARRPTLPRLRLRPPRHARPLPRMRRRPRGGGEGGAGMRRKLFTLAVGASAVVCAGACGLWWRSYEVTDELRWTSTRRQVVAESWIGRVIVMGAFDLAGEVAPRDRFRHAVHIAPETVLIEMAAEAKWRLRGLAYQPPTPSGKPHTGSSYTLWLAAVPYWL